MRCDIRDTHCNCSCPFSLICYLPALLFALRRPDESRGVRRHTPPATLCPASPFPPHPMLPFSLQARRRRRRRRRFPSSVARGSQPPAGGGRLGAEGTPDASSAEARFTPAHSPQGHPAHARGSCCASLPALMISGQLCPASRYRQTRESFAFSLLLPYMRSPQAYTIVECESSSKRRVFVSCLAFLDKPSSEARWDSLIQLIRKLLQPIRGVADTSRHLLTRRISTRVVSPTPAVCIHLRPNAFSSQAPFTSSHHPVSPSLRPVRHGCPGNDRWPSSFQSSGADSRERSFAWCAPAVLDSSYAPRGASALVIFVSLLFCLFQNTCDRPRPVSPQASVTHRTRTADLTHRYKRTTHRACRCLGTLTLRSSQSSSRPSTQPHSPVTDYSAHSRRLSRPW